MCKISATLKRSNVWFMGIAKGTEKQVEGTENLFYEIIAGNVPHIRKMMGINRKGI
jgi:hypothetical protein